jgi:hypothetical protein
MAIDKEVEVAILKGLIARTEQEIFQAVMEENAANRTENKEWQGRCKAGMVNLEKVLYIYNEELKKREEELKKREDVKIIASAN